MTMPRTPAAPRLRASLGRRKKLERGAASATSSARREAKRARAGEAALITEKSQYGQTDEQKGTWR